MTKNRVAAQWVALLCAMLIALHAPLAHAMEDWGLTDAEHRAVEMIFQVYELNDAKEQELLLLQAVQTAPDSPFILLECANLLSMLNAYGALTDTIEMILQRAKSIAMGELHGEALRALGDHYMQTQGVDAARVFIEEELAKAPDDVTLQIMLAKVCYYDGQTEAAVSILDDTLEDFPQALEAANLRALLLLELSRWNEALAAYHLIEERFPDSPESLNGRYLAYIATGQFDLAVRAVNEEIFYTRNELLWVERLNVRLYKQHDPAPALAEAEALMKAHPDWVDAYIAKMNALLMMERYDEAIDTAREFSKIDETLAKALEGLALLSCSRWDEAKALLLPSLLAPELRMIWADVALLYLQGYDDTDSAMDAIMESFAAPNNMFYSFMRLGDLNAHIENPLEAARCYYRAEQYAQSDAQAMQMLVVTLIDAGRREDAANYLEKMEARYPGWYETMIARIIYESAFGIPKEALASFAALREKFPFPASIMQPAEAILLLAAGDAKGEKLIEAWLNQKDPESLSISEWLQYAQALQYTKNIEKINDALDMAESHLEKIDPARENDIRRYRAELSAHRAEVARLSGDMEGCIRWLAEACGLGLTLLVDTLEAPDGSLYSSDAYDELYQQYGPGDEPWDITVLPTMPRQ